MGEDRKSFNFGEIIRRLLGAGKLENRSCSHLASAQDVTPSAEGCEDCLRTGDEWVHLRICMICGHVGCCDNSKNRHATQHFHDTGHPLIQSFEPGEDWMWCFADNLLITEI